MTKSRLDSIFSGTLLFIQELYVMHLKKFCEGAPDTQSAGRSANKDPQYDFCGIQEFRKKGLKFADNEKMKPLAFPEYKDFYKNAESWRRVLQQMY